MSENTPSAKRRYPRGVSYSRKRGKYQARITFNKKQHTSPYFDTAQEAGSWYEMMSRQLYGYNHKSVSDGEWKIK